MSKPILAIASLSILALALAFAPPARAGFVEVGIIGSATGSLGGVPFEQAPFQILFSYDTAAVTEGPSFFDPDPSTPDSFATAPFTLSFHFPSIGVATIPAPVVFSVNRTLGQYGLSRIDTFLTLIVGYAPEFKSVHPGDSFGPIRDRTPLTTPALAQSPTTLGLLITPEVGAFFIASPQAELVVPEPASALLFALGGLGLIAWAKRRLRH